MIAVFFERLRNLLRYLAKYSINISTGRKLYTYILIRLSDIRYIYMSNKVLTFVCTYRLNGNSFLWKLVCIMMVKMLYSTYSTLVYLSTIPPQRHNTTLLYPIHRLSIKRHFLFCKYQLFNIILQMLSY